MGVSSYRRYAQGDTYPGRAYLYGHCTCFWLFIRMVLAQSHILLFSYSVSYSITQSITHSITHSTCCSASYSVSYSESKQNTGYNTTILMGIFSTISGYAATRIYGNTPIRTGDLIGTLAFGQHISPQRSTLQIDAFSGLWPAHLSTEIHATNRHISGLWPAHLSMEINAAIDTPN